jgi:hypothetical protein
MGQEPRERPYSQEAEENLKAYVEFAYRVWERIENDPEAYEAMCRLLEARRKDGDSKD